jgi:hypothetical protein
MRLPTIAPDGVPFCSRKACPSYDGKRCREIGFMPDVICGPEVAAIAEELRTLRGSREGGAR